MQITVILDNPFNIWQLGIHSQSGLIDTELWTIGDSSATANTGHGTGNTRTNIFSVYKYFCSQASIQIQTSKPAKTRQIMRTWCWYHNAWGRAVWPAWSASPAPPPPRPPPAPSPPGGPAPCSSPSRWTGTLQKYRQRPKNYSIFLAAMTIYIKEF